VLLTLVLASWVIQPFYQIEVEIAKNLTPHN